MERLFINIYQRDRWFNGFSSGLFFPLVLFAGLLYLVESMGIISVSQQPGHPGLKPRTIALIALCINLILMQVFKRLRWSQSMRGMAVSTFICVALWLFKYGNELF